jgi:HD superfamily phosphodiesterase
MPRIKQLENKVRAFYESKNLDRADWADWLYQNHIFVVADNATQLAKRFGGNSDIVVSASMLHDIGDAIMSRENPLHEEKSKEIARNLLRECKFSEDEIEIIVNDAIEFHGCKNGLIPKTHEGKVMATADAIAHLTSNFYDYALDTLKKTDTVDDINNWALPKIERDFRDKIFFEDIRLELKSDYERVKRLFT